MGPPEFESGSPPPQDGRITRLPHGPSTPIIGSVFKTLLKSQDSMKIVMSLGGSVLSMDEKRIREFAKVI